MQITFNRFRFPPITHWIFAIVLFASPNGHGTEEAAMRFYEIQPPSIEELELLPKNLARWHLGASLLLPAENGEFRPIRFYQQESVKEARLLQDEIATGFPLEPGVKDVVIDLGDFFPVSRFSALSFSAIGSVSLHGSETLQAFGSNRWVPLGPEIPFARRDYIDLRFPLADIRFLWVRFNTGEPGEVSSLGVMGLVDISRTLMVARPAKPKPDAAPDAAPAGETEMNPDADTPRPAPDSNGELPGALAYNFASIYSNSRVVYTSGGDPRLANYLIDDDLLSYYEVPSDNAQAVFVIDLADSNPVDSVSMVMESGNATIEGYFVDTLPFIEPTPQDAETVRFWRDAATGQPLLLASFGDSPVMADIRFAQTTKARPVNVDPGFFDALGKPVIVNFTSDMDRVKLHIPVSSARYAILRWIPDDPAGATLRVFQINVMGRVEPEERLVEYQITPDAAASAATEFAALETGENDLLDTPGSPVEAFENIDDGDVVLPDLPVASP